MKRGETGRYEIVAAGGEEVRAFVPAPLPPVPPLELAELQEPLERALLALGRLDGFSTLLPDAHLFLYAYVRKEAVLSSQIEGTQSSLSDLLLFEREGAPGVPVEDVVEVSSYVSALRVHRAMQQRPVVSLPEVAEATGLSFPAASSGMRVLERLGIARELTGRKRDRLFGYEEYLAILGEGTEPL